MGVAEKSEDKKLTTVVDGFIEKNKGFARLISREALSADEQNVSDAVNQFFERLELSIKQMLAEDSDNLIAQPGVSAQLKSAVMLAALNSYGKSKIIEIEKKL